MIYESIVRRTPIKKGWSGDRKFCITASDGHPYLLRISPLEQLEKKNWEFFKMQEVSALGIPMCQPIEFGICEEGVYSIQSWIFGADLESLVDRLSTEGQYSYGLEAGQILKKIHTIPAPAYAPDWESRFNQKIDHKISMYQNCPLKYRNGDLFLDYLSQNRHLLAGRPQSYHHGDYHIGNMMIDAQGVLTIIDFDRDGYGDPWEEFNRIVWCAQKAPRFAWGMIDGYFDGNVPMEFWRLLALYISSNTLSSLPWAIPFGEKEVQIMTAQAEQVLLWYSNLSNLVPIWYAAKRED